MATIMAKTTGPSVEDINRRYHDTESAYLLPNDPIEQDRLDAQAAAIVEMIGGRPCLAPVVSMRGISKVVDVGCGTGVTTVHIAEMFSAATVYGLDLSEITEAVQNAAPSNVVWTKGDVLDVRYDNNAGETAPSTGPVSEVFKPESLDYIFGRMLFLGINDWPRYFATSARALKSGGIIEHQDLDWAFYRTGTSQCLNKDWEWHKTVTSAITKVGLSPNAGSSAVALMKAAGLEIISVQTFEFSFVPCNKVANSISMGRYVQQKLVPQYPELLRRMLAVEGISGSKLQELTHEALKNISSEEGIYQKYTVTVARKPWNF